MSIATGVSRGAGRNRPSVSSLVDVFRNRAEYQPDQIAFTYLPDDDSAPLNATYGDLDRRARAIAARLQQTCRPGDRALLVYGPGLEYAAALAGCLYAGVVAVPAYPPDPMRVARTFSRLEAIVRDADVRVILGTTFDLAWTGAMFGQIPGVESLIATCEIDATNAADWRAPTLRRDQLALIQYTSGSTGDPKGVMIQHGNALQNLAQIEQTIDIDDAVVAMWLPAYHDMGLIGGILQCWYSGRRNVLMSPLAFFQRPLRWLQAISQYRATTTGAPNFAYELCIRKTTAEERRELDLSCWRLALCGAEPVRPQTIDSFVEAFADCGVRREIFRPCFGLAEATLMVSCAEKSTPPTIRSFDANQLADGIVAEMDAREGARRVLAGCGPSVVDQQIAIVDPQTLVELPAGHVGEVWVAGRNVAAGYWKRPEESQAVFAAHTAAGTGPYLRTGDAGFLYRGELFISGRLKEVIIVRGRNYFPADLEQTVQASDEAFRGCSGAAFSFESEERERVVMVQEVARPKRFDLESLSHEVRRSILEIHDVLVDTVVLVRRGTIPKTTSGKIQRGACREQFLSRSLQTLHCWKSPQLMPGKTIVHRAYVPPRTPTEAVLAEAWADVLGIDRVGIQDNFIELGGHSLLAAQLANRLGPRLGLEIPLSELFARPTIAALAELVDARRAALDDSDRELLERLDALSDDEAQALLADFGNSADVLTHRDSAIG